MHISSKVFSLDSFSGDSSSKMKEEEEEWEKIFARRGLSNHLIFNGRASSTVIRSSTRMRPPQDAKSLPTCRLAIILPLARGITE